MKQNKKPYYTGEEYVRKFFFGNKKKALDYINFSIHRYQEAQQSSRVLDRIEEYKLLIKEIEKL
jgi:hypothetical protein